MPIITECPDCDRPIMVGMGPGAFAPHECDDCGCEMVIEMTRIGGTTYERSDFLENVLPGLDLERIDHPIADVYVYGDPEQTKPRPIDTE